MMGEAAMARWWGEVRVEQGQTVRWQVGPLVLWLQRLEGEWRIFRLRHDDPLLDSVDIARAVPETDIADEATIERFAFGGASPLLDIGVRLPDRPIVSRPEHPFHIPPGEEVLLFLGSPLWISVATAKPARRLFDMPVFRPSDTWFGPTTTEGELCYASRTLGLLRVEDAPRCPHRCITAVTIRNRADDELSLDRVKLPVGLLDVFVADDGRLWTNDVLLERREEGEHARLSVSRKAPARAPSPRMLTEARGVDLGDAMIRVFSTLFAG